MKILNKITAAVLMLCFVICGLVPVYAADGVTITIESNQVGNIFFGNTDVEFEVSYLMTEEASLKAVYNVYQYNEQMQENDAIISETKILNLKANDVLKDYIKLDAKDFGMYKLSVTVYSQDTQIAQKDVEFSRCVESEALNATLGACTHLTTRGDIDDSLFLMKKAGMGIVRDDFRWTDYEKVKGEYKLTNEASRIIKRAAYYGIDVLAILYGKSRWYGNSDYSFVTEETDLDKFEEFVKSIMETEEFQKYINNVEILNEPDVATLANIPATDKSDANQKVRGEAYARLLKRAYDAVNEVKPSANVGAFVTCSSNTSGSRNFIKYALEYMQANNYGMIFDAATAHIYHGENYPEQLDFSGSGYLGGFSNLVDGYYTGSQKWYTEYGSYTDAADDETGFWAENEYKQALKNIRTYFAVKKFNMADKLYLYQLEGDATGKNWGILNSNNSDVPYSANASYLAVANVNNLIAKATECEPVVDENGKHILKFTTPEREVYAMYATTGTATHSGTIENVAAYYDFYGNVLKAEDVITNGVYNLTEAPIYAVCGTLPQAVEDEGYVISGKIASGEADKEVSLSIVNADVEFSQLTPLNIKYIDQQKSTDGGKFRFTVDIEDGNYVAYLVSEDNLTPISIVLSDGSEKNIELNLYSGVSKIENAKIDVTDLKKAYAEIKFKNYDEASDYSLFYAIYNEGKLMGAQKKEGKSVLGDSSVQFDLSDSTITEFDNIRLMLWDGKNSMEPICDVLNIQ